MKKFILSFLMLLTISTSMSAQSKLNPTHYDVNGDGDVSIADVTCLVNAILGKVRIPISSIAITDEVYIRVKESYVISATVTPADADYLDLIWKSSDESIATVDQTGKVTGIGKGSCTITATASDGSGVASSCKVTVKNEDNMEYVDLGLPSGTLWASCNIGASSPEDYGDYFAWGETTGYYSGKTTFSWSTYKYCQGSNNTLTKYCNESYLGYNGFTDNLTEMENEDDAAYVKWGTEWRTPSSKQFDELINKEYTSIEWITMNGVYGCKISSIISGYTDNFIFLPAAGTRNKSSLSWDGTNGYYWSRSLSDAPDLAWNLIIGKNGANTQYYDRCDGRTIRPVRMKEREYVDLGLPSGTLWATCNIGASSPEEYGGYFAWGETTGYTSDTSDGRSFDWSTYTYCQGSYKTMTKYCDNSICGYNGFTDNLTELELTDDAAYVNWGSKWRMPSRDQCYELINSSNTTTEWTTVNGVYGRKITSKSNGNSIFLPAAGDRGGTSLYGAGSYGYYWSRSLYTSYPYDARYLNINSSDVYTSNNYRYSGRSVRPVRFSE